MTHPTACIRCHGTELVDAVLETPGAPRLVVDAAHASAVNARVCMACGAVLLTAVSPHALRVGGTPERDVQEYDF